MLGERSASGAFSKFLAAHMGPGRNWEGEHCLIVLSPGTEMLPSIEKASQMGIAMDEVIPCWLILGSPLRRNLGEDRRGFSPSP